LRAVAAESNEAANATAGLAEVRCDQGRFDEAIALRRSLDALVDDDEYQRLLASARGADGYRRIDRQYARVQLENLKRDQAAGRYVAPIDRARFYAQLGDTVHAMQSLDEALDIRDPGVVFLRVDEVWRPMRSDPRFAAAVKRVGLP
jgi:tetratricopeptide (TPR) repeat protein